jgi:hypothetical protein
MDPVESEIDSIIKATTQNIGETSNTQHENTNPQEEVNNDNNNDNNNNNNDNNDNNDNSPDDKSTINSQNIEVFNIALHQYLKIDEEIKALLEAIKLRNKTKKDLAETLGTYLRANEIRNVNLGGSYKGKKLETKVTYSSKGFSKENVTKVLYDELKEEADVFDKIMESISRTNVITEKWNLKIVSDKEKSTKSKTEKAKNKIDVAEELLNEED